MIQSAGHGGFLNEHVHVRRATGAAPDPFDTTLRRGVEFAKLLSWSSLGSQESLADRQTGRREIEAREARLRGVLGEEGAADGDDAARAAERELEFRIAEALELRGYTFEAEMRFHRLSRDPRAALRLAQLLEAKGFRHEALELYVRAARGGHVSALLRLAVLCRGQGDDARSRRLLRAAWRTAGDEARRRTRAVVHELARARRPGRSPRPLPLGQTGDDAFLLGAVLLVGAGRGDLARVAYCTATASGSTLAALALLDLGRTERVAHDHARVDDLFARGLRDVDEEVDEPPTDLARALHRLGDGLDGRSVGDLLDRARRGDEAERRQVAERFSATLAGVAFLWAYARLGCSEEVRARVEEAASASAERVRVLVQAGVEGEPTAMLRDLVNAARDDMVNDREMPRGKRLLRAGDPRDDVGPECAKREFPASGAVHRLHREFRLFGDRQLTVVVLRLAGIGAREVAGVVGESEDAAEETMRLSIAQLHAGQSGEHHYHQSTELLWAEIESCFGGAARPGD